MNIKKLTDKVMGSLDYSPSLGRSPHLYVDLPIKEQFKKDWQDIKKNAVYNTIMGSVVLGMFAIPAGYAIYSSANAAIERSIAPKPLGPDDETLRYRQLKAAEGVVSPSSSSRQAVRELVSDLPRIFKDGASYMLGLPGHREPIKLSTWRNHASPGKRQRIV